MEADFEALPKLTVEQVLKENPDIAEQIEEEMLNDDWDWGSDDAANSVD